MFRYIAINHSIVNTMSEDSAITIPADLNDTIIQESATNTVVSVSTSTVSTIETTATTSVAEAEAETTVTTAAATHTYEYCHCYGSFIAEVDQPNIDSLVILAQQIHGDIEAIVPEDDCPCPVCIGQLQQCYDCDGLYLMIDEDETHEMEEYEEEELRDSPIDFAHDEDDCQFGGCSYCYNCRGKEVKEELDEAMIKKLFEEEEDEVATLPKSAFKPLSMAQALIISSCCRR